MHPITSIACALTLLATTGFAQGTYGPTGGQQLFSIGGALSRQTIDFAGGSVATNSFNAQAGVGYFITDVHEVGVQVNESFSDSNPGPKTVSTGLAPYYNYNFRNSPRTWFYVGVHAGAQVTDSGGKSETDFAYGVHAGVRHWLSQSAAIFAEPRVTRSKFNSDTLDTEEIIFGYSVVL